MFRSTCSFNDDISIVPLYVPSSAVEGISHESHRGLAVLPGMSNRSKGSRWSGNKNALADGSSPQVASFELYGKAERTYRSISSWKLFFFNIVPFSFFRSLTLTCTCCSVSVDHTTT